MVGLWYIGRGDAIGVILTGNAELYIMGCIGGCELDEFGLEYIGVEGMDCICWWYMGICMLGCWEKWPCWRLSDFGSGL
jgi:hypothetical protein